MTGTEHPLVTDYLATIEREASFLPAGRREELLADLREHLAVAIGDEPGPEAVRAALERLGSPSTIVAAARAEEPETPATPSATTITTATTATTATRLEPQPRNVITAVLIGATGLVGLADPLPAVAVLIAGLVLLWSSDAWDRGTKTLATALTLATPLVIALGGLLLAYRLDPTALFALVLTGIALPAVAAFRLLRTQNRPLVA
ncbi:HAAS signaling domain-containing protein [Streptomyces sp. NPDC058872]|uniref:HAAS signaling domain-containing protein n=1 Tax=Streptomyces sp. NPDC058872 TaxID=3346661 RepID=UPI0036AFBDAE